MRISLIVSPHVFLFHILLFPVTESSRAESGPGTLLSRALPPEHDAMTWKAHWIGPFHL